MSVFDKYAAYYDVLYGDKDYQNESDFIHGLINQFKPDTRELIEFGSGSGIHAELLAKHFDHVYGVDLSLQMVEMAEKRQERSKYADRLNFSQGNIEEVRLDLKVDCLISLFHVYSYLTSNHSLKRGMQNAANHLKEGGLFIFDFWYAPAVLSMLPEYREKEMENENYRVFRKSIPEHLINDNIVNVNFQVEIHDKKSGQVEHLEECHPMRYFTLPELEYILNDTGFRILKTGEWPTQTPPNKDSWGVYIVAEKRSS
jgi:SAM-dependent methyltransferase